MTYAIDDYTEHTYATNAGPIGSFVQFGVTRLFAYPIRTIKVAIVAGTADDIGYVGDVLVTPGLDGAPQCSPVAQVTNTVDATSAVQTNGNAATLQLRAEENCCCSTGWGLEDGGTNARLHWQVQIALPPKLEVSQSEGQLSLGWTTNWERFAPRSHEKSVCNRLAGPKSRTRSSCSGTAMSSPILLRTTPGCIG